MSAVFEQAKGEQKMNTEEITQRLRSLTHQNKKNKEHTHYQAQALRARSLFSEHTAAVLTQRILIDKHHIHTARMNVHEALDAHRETGHYDPEYAEILFMPVAERAAHELELCTPDLPATARQTKREVAHRLRRIYELGGI